MFVDRSDQNAPNQSMIMTRDLPPRGSLIFTRVCGFSNSIVRNLLERLEMIKEENGSLKVSLIEGKNVKVFDF